MDIKFVAVVSLAFCKFASREVSCSNVRIRGRQFVPNEIPYIETGGDHKKWEILALAQCHAVVDILCVY